MRATEQQLQIAGGQLQVTLQELHRSRVARLQDNKPTVVLDRRDYPERGEGNSGWVLCNIGRGFAINIFEVNAAKGRWRSLGGLAAGAERPIPHELDAELRNSGDVNRFEHIIIAEGPPSRTRRWNPTLNLLRTDATVVHLFTYPQGLNDNPSVSRAESKLSLDDYLAANLAALTAQFGTMPSG